MHHDTGQCGSRRRASLLAMAALLAGCGSQSTAASDSVAAAAPANGAATPVLASAQAVAASPTVLPIEQGLYISGYRTPDGIYFTADDSPDAASACKGATDLFFYDGAHTGEIGSDEFGHWTNAAVSISRVGPARKPLAADLARASRGFTLVWDAAGERKGIPSLALKATGPGRFTHLSMGSFGQSSYMKCSFGQLSLKMQGAVRAEQPQMASARVPQAPGASDEEAVRALVGSIYGWRDGRRVEFLDEWRILFSPRIESLLAQCGAAQDNADPRANEGEGAYTVLGDQGCVGAPFLLEPVGGDPAPFIPKSRPLLRRIGADTIEVEIVVPPADREYWGWSQTLRFQRSGGSWLIDEILTRTGTGTDLYSSGIQQNIVELRKIAKKPRRR
ncbi:hypothetical protein [Sphingopyxis sp.]|uniref:hypothetical protein n=1 Tax=Sphingopyxis sp. TaxID=1908224 RepID=UPI00262056C5|nr:hypothetical protein [Sphingopyxis sp.]MCW0197002.1 hypothetical protein [Sphingopyxis sp.]